MLSIIEVAKEAATTLRAIAAGELPELANGDTSQVLKKAEYFEEIASRPWSAPCGCSWSGGVQKLCDAHKEAPENPVTLDEGARILGESKDPAVLSHVGLGLVVYARGLEEQLKMWTHVARGMQSVLRDLVHVIAVSGAMLAKSGLGNHPAAVKLRQMLERMQKEANAPPEKGSPT
jgi:hypothetical protein